MKVSELMNSSVVSITPDETASLAAQLLHRHNIGSLPVCGSDGRLCGIVTDRDIVMRCVATQANPSSTKIEQIMTHGVVSVSPDTDVREATRLMAKEQVRRLPVVNGTRLVGMLSLGDMAKTQSFDMEASKALADISSNVKKAKK